MPGWVGPTVAISLVIIAIAFAAMGFMTVALGRTVDQKVDALSRELAALRNELHGVIEGARRIAESGQELSGEIRAEVQRYLATSQAIRHDVERGLRRVKGRLADLEALYDVVHGEVEDTALDVAAGLRTVRRGAGMVGRLRRWMVRSRR